MTSEFQELAVKPFQIGPKSSNLHSLLGEHYLNRLESKFKCVEASTLHFTLRELLRYLYLSAHSPSSVFFPGDLLMDDLWHALITETAEYEEFCQRLRPGCFIHHSGIKFKDYVERSGEESVQSEQTSWLASYVKNFGEMDQDAFDCLNLAQELASRMNGTLGDLNALGKGLLKLHEDTLALQRTEFNFDNFVKNEVFPNSNQIDEDPQILGSFVKATLKGLKESVKRDINALTNAELEKLFGASTALSFCLWQHLAVVERLSGLPEWQKGHLSLWESIASGETLAGLATTHLAKPNGAGVKAIETEDGFILNGEAPWVCGYQIFDLLLVGCETENSVVFLLTEFPNPLVHLSIEGVQVHTNKMVCLNGTSTVSLSFKDKLISKSNIVSRREKAQVPVPRSSSYIIPEIGIGKAVLGLIDDIVSGSAHPRHKLIQNSLEDLKARVSKINELRIKGDSSNDLIFLRDEFNRDAVRLYSLAAGAKALAQGSLASRLQLEMFLMDSVMHSPMALEKKIKRIGGGSET